MAEFKIQYFHITQTSDIEIPDAVSVCLQSHCCWRCPWLSFNIAHNMHKVGGGAVFGKIRKVSKEK